EYRSPVPVPGRGWRRWASVCGVDESELPPDEEDEDPPDELLDAPPEWCSPALEEPPPPPPRGTAWSWADTSAGTAVRPMVSANAVQRPFIATSRSDPLPDGPCKPRTAR